MEFYIFDEKKQICQGEKTGIWTAGYFYRTNSKKGGKIEIPYQDNEEGKVAILMDGEFAELAQITKLADFYELRCAMILPLESLIVGNSVSLILKPVLRHNAITADLSKLTNIKFSLTMQTTTQGETTKVFEIEKFESDAHVIQFDVTSEIVRITGNLSADIKRASGTTQSLSYSLNSEYMFRGNDYKSVHDFRRGYLRKSEAGEYEYLCL